MEYEVLTKKPMLRAADNRLSFLASKAAVELKMFSIGKRDDLPSVQKLSNLIHNSVDQQEPNVRTSLMNPSTVSIMSQALEEAQWSPTRPKTISELVDVALDVVNVMNTQCSGSKRNGDIQRMMDFCVALARSSSAYRKTIFNTKRKHPFLK